MKYYYAAINEAGEVKALYCGTAPLPPALPLNTTLATFTAEQHRTAMCILHGTTQQIRYQQDAIQVLPLWEPTGLPLATRRRRRMYEVTAPATLTLTWVGGPLLVGVNHQPATRLSSPLTMVLDQPGRYVLQSKDPAWTDTEYIITATEHNLHEPHHPRPHPQRRGG